MQVAKQAWYSHTHQQVLKMILSNTGHKVPTPNGWQNTY